MVELINRSCPRAEGLELFLPCFFILIFTTRMHYFWQPEARDWSKWTGSKDVDFGPWRFLGKSSWTLERGLLRGGSKFLPRTCPSASHSGLCWPPPPPGIHIFCVIIHTILLAGTPLPLLPPFFLAFKTWFNSTSRKPSQITPAPNCLTFLWRRAASLVYGTQRSLRNDTRQHTAFRVHSTHLRTHFTSILGADTVFCPSSWGGSSLSWAWPSPSMPP